MNGNLQEILGWTGRANGPMSLAGLPAELAAQLSPPQWEYTDRRSGSATEGLTVYVGAGATEDEVRRAIEDKTAVAMV